MGRTSSARDLATQFQLDYNDLDDGLGNISLHELVNSGVASLDELVREGLLVSTNLTDGSFSLGELLDSGLAEVTDLIGESLLQVEDLATNGLNLEGLLDSGLTDLETLVSDSLVGLSDLSLDQIDIAGLIRIRPGQSWRLGRFQPADRRQRHG